MAGFAISGVCPAIFTKFAAGNGAIIGFLTGAKTIPKSASHAKLN